MLKRYLMDILVAGLIYTMGFLSACLICRSQLHEFRAQVENCQKRIQYYQNRELELERLLEQVREIKSIRHIEEGINKALG